MKNNIKETKGLIMIMILCVIGFFTSCTDLDEDPSEARLDPSSLNSTEALEAAVAGAYSKAALTTQWAQMWINAYGGDDVTTWTKGNKQAFREADQRVLTSTSARINSAWNWSFAVVKEVNNIIENKDNITGTDQAKIDALVGEAYFLRAFHYFHMTQAFGKLPINLTTAIESDLASSEIDEVYKQIESDFLIAESLLPEIYPDVSAAIRPNSGSARAYLAKLYLHWAGWPLKDNSKYAMAASSAKAVIDNATVHGFALVPDMNTLWSITDENRLNSEIVFGVAHCQECGNQYSNRYTGKLGYPASVGGWSEVFAEIAFMEDFPEGPRKDATYLLDVEHNGNVINWKDFEDEPHPLFRKITGQPSEIAIGNSTTSLTTYHMRYADLLLIYAEAEGRSGGNSADAWEALNKVRRRASALPVNTPNPSVDLSSGDLAELAYTERKWELAGEFQRWNDLVRMERVAAALANRSPDELVGPILGDTSPANYFVPPLPVR